MGAWDRYNTIISNSGTTKRERTLKRAQKRLSKNIGNSLSSHLILINGNTQRVTILNEKESTSLKRIIALPGENLIHGGIVDFANSKWLITDVDADNELYESGQMQRCNYLLKWVNKAGQVVEKWSIVEDGTKYLIGEKNEDMMAIGDARVAVTVGKDSDTIELDRGKRFLIDDADSDAVLAYQITKPNKLYNIYDNKGVFRFILNEVNRTDNDNIELRVADYYNNPLIPDGINNDSSKSGRKSGWL